MALMLALVACATAFTSCNNDDDLNYGDYHAKLILLDDGQKLDEAQKKAVTTIVDASNVAFAKVAGVNEAAAEVAVKAINGSSLGAELEKSFSSVNVNFTGSAFKIKHCYATEAGKQTNASITIVFEDGKFKTHSN